MATATTSSSIKDEGPALTPQEISEKKAELDAEIDAEYGKDPSEQIKEEPAEKLDSENEPEQKQETSEEVIPEAEEKSEQDPQEELGAKDKRYKEQLLGERKANQELAAKIQALEFQLGKITTNPPQQKEISPEEQQLLAEKQMLIDKYGVVTKEQYEALELKLQNLLDARLKPVQKKREESILKTIYAKFPDISPDKDPTNEKWTKVNNLLSRFVPANAADPLDDYEERFEWAYEKAFGKKPNYAQVQQASYVGIGGGSSAVKSRTTVGNDKYAHLSPAVRARKEAFDRTLEEEWAREDVKKR